MTITWNNEGAAGAPNGGAAPDLGAQRSQIDETDAEILRLVRRRAENRPRPRTRVLARNRELGQEGSELGSLLLWLGRGRLGHP